MSSERSQTQKVTNSMIPFIGYSGEVRIIGIKKKKKQVTGCQGLEVEEGVVIKRQDLGSDSILSLDCVQFT